MIDADHWQRRLRELAERDAVPGAVLGIDVAGDTATVACGVSNVDTGIEVTADTLFQIGSVTKVWTATVLMRFVDDGRLALDDPVVRHLPEFPLSDKEITVRRLLTHTSGLDGDFFHDTGRGDDCLERYVAALAGLPVNHPVGATWSYCNTGFVILGRLLEKLAGQRWDTVMAELLFEPLGLAHSMTLPEDVLRFRSATGHVHEGDEPPRPTAVWSLPRSLGPAGLVVSTAADVLAFARMHLAGGVAGDGTRVLAERAVLAMQAEETVLPARHLIADSYGLGWARYDWSGTTVIGHDGNTIGQSAFLRVLPVNDVAITLLTNGGRAADLYETLVGEVVPALTGVEPPPPLLPPDTPVEVDVEPYLGGYERTGVRIELVRGMPGVCLRVTDTNQTPGLARDVQEFDLTPVRDGLFAYRRPGTTTWRPLLCYTVEGRRYVHDGARATPRVS